MKKRIFVSCIGIVLLLTACGNSPAKDTIYMTEMYEIDDEEEAVEESEETTAPTEVVEEDPNAKAKELVDRYGGCQLSYVTPIVGDYFEFRYTDVIKAVEDIWASPTGTYIAIRFENSAQDTIMEDRSRPSGEYTTTMDEWQKLYDAEDEMNLPHTYQAPNVESAPLAGEEGTYEKRFVVSEIEDTGVLYDEDKLYIIRNEHGMEQLVRVSEYEYSSVVPKPKETMCFRVEDVVTSVEEPLYSTWRVVHFENSYNDMVIEDMAYETAVADDYDAYLAAKKQYNQKGLRLYEAEKTPEVGKQVAYEKYTEVTNVTMLKEDEDGFVYYLVEGIGGIQTKCKVHKGSIPTNDTWEYGTLNESEYIDENHGIVVDLSSPDIKEVEIYNYAHGGVPAGESGNKCVARRISELSGQMTNYQNFYFNFTAYEFKDEVTEEDALEALQNSRTYANETIVEDQVIAGNTYHTILLTSFSGDESYEWYRVDGDRMYTLSYGGAYDNDHIFSMLK